MQNTWLCLIPFLIVIPIVMMSKKVSAGLFCGLLVGSFLMHPSLLGGLEGMVNYLVKNIVKTSNIEIVFFLFAFAGLVGMVKFTGGIKGFAHLLSGKIKSKKSALFLGWILILGTFSEPDFSIVTRGSILKPLAERMGISKRHVGYSLEFTANPFIAVVPVATAFVGYMVSLIGQAMKGAGMHGTPFVTYVKSIPFNFFSFVVMLVGIYFSFIKKPKEAAESEKAKDNGSKEGTGLNMGGGQPAFNTEMGDEMPTDENVDTTGIQAHLEQAQIDLAEAEVYLKQGQNDLMNMGGNANNNANPQQQTPNSNGINQSQTNPGNASATPMNMENSADTSPINTNQQAMDSPKKDMSSDPVVGLTTVDPQALNTEMSSEGSIDIHGDSTGVFQKQESQNDPNKALKESHRAFNEETPSKPFNLIIPIGLFIALTLFLSWWDGHTKANSFFGAFIKTNMLLVMLTSLLTAIIVAVGFYLFQKFPSTELASHFIKGGNELVNVIVMLTLIWALTAVSEDLGFSHFISNNVKGWIPHWAIAPTLFALGAVISYFIGSSWGTWGLLMPLGVTLAAQSHSSILLCIGAVFSSGTFGAFCSPLSDNTVTTCTVVGMPVTKYARSKLTPALIAAGISVILFGVFSFIIH